MCERIKKKKTNPNNCVYPILYLESEQKLVLGLTFYGQTGVSIPDGIGQRMCFWNSAGD